VNYSQMRPGQQKLIQGLGAAGGAVVLAITGSFIDIASAPQRVAGFKTSITLMDSRAAFFHFPWAVVAIAAALAYQWSRPLPLERRRGLAIGLAVAAIVGVFDWLALWRDFLYLGDLGFGYWLIFVGYLLSFFALWVLARPQIEGRDAVPMMRPAAPPQAPGWGAPPAAPQVAEFAVTADAPIYNQPSLTAPQLGMLRRGQRVQVRGRNAGMLEVQLNAWQVGYVDERFLILVVAPQSTGGMTPGGGPGTAPPTPPPFPARGPGRPYAAGEDERTVEHPIPRPPDA
jgi:hypothetical protein